MNIPDLLYKIKSLRNNGDSEVIHFDKEGNVERHGAVERVFLTLVVLLVGTLSFGLGRLSTMGERPQMSLNFDPNLAGESNSSTSSISASTATSSMNNKVVTASSKGTRFYFSHCRNTISDKNRITFATPALAVQAGYTLAANCVSR